MSRDVNRRVLYVDCSPWTGGAQLSFLSLVTSMQAEGYTPYVLSADKETGGILQRCEQAGIHAQPIRARHWRKSLPGFHRFLRDRRKVRRPLADALAHASPTLVHVNGVRAMLLLMGKLPADLPVVLHDRDIRIPPLVRALAARHADRIVAISECVGRKWRGVLPEDHVKVIPNGFDLERISRTGPAQLPSGLREASLAVCVADMVRWKRHDLFIKGIAEARARGCGVSGLIIGRVHDAPGETILRELRDLTAAVNLGECVEILTDQDDALPWISAADILVSASAKEPFGRTVVEALALGKAVVATAGAGPEEILTGCRGGFLVEATPEDMARGIEEASEGVQRGLVRDASQRRAKDFSLANMIRPLKTLYRELSPRDA